MTPSSAPSNLFSGFDFNLLDSPHFREDSVREELVAPLLHALGYSPSPPHRIIRSRPLQHPFVYIGTIQKPISIIPDYLLQRDGEDAWILDAKGPNEAIDTGRNVEQAFSYAIHKDVRVPLYALCNGRRLTVFHISRWPALLDISLSELPHHWSEVLNLLGTRAAWLAGVRPGFLPDFGLMLRKTGLHQLDGQKTFQMFTSVPIQFITKLEDDLYSLTSQYRQEYAPGQYSEMMLTFDFAASVYRTLLEALPTRHREAIEQGLTRQPYRLLLEDPDPPLVMVAAELGDTVRTNGDESYCPFVAEKFLAQPPLD